MPLESLLRRLLAQIVLNYADEQYKTYPLWKGVLAWALLVLIVAFIFS